MKAKAVEGLTVATPQHYADLRTCVAALVEAGHHENAKFLLKHLERLEAIEAKLCK
jgi:hypothetical protein